ncbi:hypothetical protein [Streptomyces sp. NPDC050738]|uniref:hypothetical protein n=1 Tax=Streptomyces sp. NPDC050738 TaxID=3154744 RepID=UPI00343147FE
MVFNPAHYASHWPTPEAAYALAPSILREIGWTADQALTYVRTDFHRRVADREFWLRKAALLDRIAVTDEKAGIYADAIDVAVNAARRLLSIDREQGLGPSGFGDGPYVPEHPDSIAEPRGYVRQEYAIWAKNPNNH